jgi:hypothetical protein
VLDPWTEEVYATDRLFRSVEGITGFARMLAGTDKRPAPSPAPTSADNEMKIESRVHHVPARTHRPVWSEVVRPSSHDVLTWDEAMRVPWIEGNAEAQQ